MERRKMRKLLTTTALIASILASGTAHAASSAASSAATGDASVTIQGVLAISQAQALNLGTVYTSDQSDAKVEVNTTGTLGSNGANVVTPGQVGIFTITGTPGAQLSGLSLPDSTVLTNTAGDEINMKLSLLAAETTLATGSGSGSTNVNASIPTTNLSLGVTGETTVTVGGSIGGSSDPFALKNKVGTYLGTYSVTVSYQ